MRRAWSLFALHKCVPLEERLSDLEELLGSSLNLDVNEIDDHCKIQQLQQTLGENVNQFVMFSDIRFQIPMALCYAGDQQAGMLFTGWLRAQGVIVLPLELDSTAMLGMADAIADQKCYDTRLVFDVITEDKNLKKVEIEVDKESFRTLSRNANSPLQQGIIPYIYERSGIMVEKLPLALVAFAGFASVGSNVITISTWSNEVLAKLLQVIK